jgi:hypothetical protein
MRVLAFILAALAFVGTAAAQSSMSSSDDFDLLDQYVAYIGPDDLYNSQGDRLREPWQIIRQDRANYHRFDIQDDLDEGDTFFAEAENRAIMEDMLRNGSISRAAARDVVAGGALVLVEIYGRRGVGYAVQITTAR